MMQGAVSDCEKAATLATIEEQTRGSSLKLAYAVSIVARNFGSN
jgi:hypothetical protein